MSDAWRGVIADIERAATPSGRKAVGSYAIEGTRLAERALAAGAELHAAVASARYARSADPRIRRLIERLETSNCSLHVVADEVVARLVNGRGNGEIAGLVRMPEQPGLAALLSGRDDRPALLIGVGVEDPGNAGALVRTALASGAAGFIGIGPCDPFHPKSVRTSMGSLFRLPVILADGFETIRSHLAELSVPTVGAVSSGGVALPDLQVEGGAVALCMGNESTGLSEEVRQGIDWLVTIPMGATIDSYSVNAAAAIILYELGRPR